MTYSAINPLLAIGSAKRARAHLLAVGLLASTIASNAAEIGVTDTSIKLGATNALSGPVASGCAPVTDGAKAWLERINKEGGVNGRTFDYQVLDDAFSPERAIGNIRRLVDRDGVFAVLAGCATATTAAILPFFVEHKEVPFLFPSAFMSDLATPVKPNVFALAPTYADQMLAILPYVIERGGDSYKTAAVLSMNVPGVDQWQANIAAVFKKRNIEILYQNKFEMTVPDKSTDVAQLKQKNPDLLVVVDSAPGGARTFIEMTRQNWKPKTVVASSSLTNEIFLSAAAAEADGLFVAPGLVTPAVDERAKACNDSLAASYPNDKPSEPAMFGCLAAQVFVEGVRRAGKDLTRSGLLQAIEGIRDFRTDISGPINFSKESHRGLGSVLPIAVIDKRFKVLGPALDIP